MPDPALRAAAPSSRVDSLGSRSESVGSSASSAKGRDDKPDRGASKTHPLSGRRAATRSRLLDSCAELIAASGFEAVSMTGVASHAGITRQTVYRYFSNAGEMVHATFLREGGKVMAQHMRIFESGADPRTIFVDCVVETLRTMLSNPVFVRAWGPRDFPASMLEATFDERFTEPAVAGMARVGDQLGWSEEDRREVYAVMARTIVSFLTIPPPEGLTEEGEADLRSYLDRRFIPSLGIPTG